MHIDFTKYQGAGNDFILCDDRTGELSAQLTRETIERLCNRRFGIGGDGLMLLGQGAEGFDFRMIYYNSDGRESTMCGNGGRCIVRFAHQLKLIGSTCRFVAIDGPHDATILDDGQVALGMNPVSAIQEVGEQDLVLDTGSPHYVRFVPDLREIDVVTTGRAVRRSPAFADQGINVNFVESATDGLRIATYERGVEDETLACGTGVTAAAIGHLYRTDPLASGNFRVGVLARGGQLAVTGNRSGGAFTDLRLIGPATFVFSGTIIL
ncbi:diaminopimelate epimerase [Neolewinella xylanilytica]|uniref:Diaminopimelate epimerase n=1 Tax=Neolewinella xylanilytica TaxID=1514080 RepID=A0A2S6I0E4_9BACT|nr:diaminopimelate epimerase [Neolewinella xylanilytica]PPK84237.1 diaminopimelate epimerase [Neolewinella xylanilytica]